MALKIRLWQQGRTNERSYRIVVADGRSPRDGKYLEAIGWYHPTRKEDQRWNLHADRLEHWLSVGAQPSDVVIAIAKKLAPTAIQIHVQRRNNRQAKRSKSKQQG